MGGGEDGVDQPVFQGHLLFHHHVDKARTLGNGLEEEFIVAFGPGRRGRFHGHFDGLAEPEAAALDEIIVDAFPGLLHFGLQVGLMALESRGAEAVFPAEGDQGGGPGG